MFTLPADAATSTLAYIGELMTDSWLFIAIAIGIPLGFYVIRKLISLVAGRAR